MSELISYPQFRVGDFLHPKDTDPIVDGLEAALNHARELSTQKQGNPVAVWDANDNTITLFAGYQQFNPA